MSNVPDFMDQRRLTLREVAVRTRSGRAGHLTVASILDEFSYASYSPEADFAPLTMRDWAAELAAAQPDLLLVESAWRGHRNTWWNEVSRLGPELQGILAWCRVRGVPTAFWNKEDPVHFSTFVTVAREFDAVFTTDVDSVPRYRAKLGHDNVHFLPFAAQPSVHNPLEKFDRVKGTAFAGAYYVRYPERTADLERLSATLSEGGTFHIYDRNFGKDDLNYAFPEDYQQFIVGGLKPSEIDVAYKGYTSNLNLNSVKQSQSMFARRVYELMASGTAVVSNYAKGLKTIFGELAMTTDSPLELARQRARLAAEPNGEVRLRGDALRKVMREHTYAERLAFIAEQVGLELPAAAPQRPLLLTTCQDAEALAVLDAMVSTQTHDDYRFCIVGERGAGMAHVAASLHDALTWGAAEGCTHLAVLDADHHYGPHYLADLLQVFDWADVPAVGLAERWAIVGDQTQLLGAGQAWRHCDELLAERALVRVDVWESFEAESLLDGHPITGLSTFALNFCEGGAKATVEQLRCVEPLGWDEGASLDELRAWAARLSPTTLQAQGELDLAELLHDVVNHPMVQLVTSADGTAVIESEVPVGQHRYIYCETTRGLDVLPQGETRSAYFEAGLGCTCQLTIIYLDETGERLGHSILYSGRNSQLEVPEGAVCVRLGVRVSGPGRAELLHYVPFEVKVSAQPLWTSGENLLVSNIYPAYDNLYRNGFVHARSRAYREAGRRFDVFVCDGRNRDLVFREFEGVPVAVVDDDRLEKTLAAGRVRTVFVHALNPRVWRAVKAHPELDQVTIWVHGAEVQPWHRRAFNYTTDEALEQAKVESDERMAFWREVFTDLPANVRFVFVSQYLADVVFEDVGIELPNERYEVIPNPVDPDIFTYREKSPELAKHILSVRPYASPTYANDLSVKAVLELSEREGFDELQFSFFGDGPLFDETLEPLRDFANVHIHQSFLTQPQIAEQHAGHGLFLVPTRMDTQGVSRDEAMMSGLVPLTSRVAAVPEFVDESCAVLAEPEDHLALAEGIWSLAHDPERFQTMSRAARERALRVAKASVVTRELGRSEQG